jgi:hypothetical protein
MAYQFVTEKRALFITKSGEVVAERSSVMSSAVTKSWRPQISNRRLVETVKTQWRIQRTWILSTGK